MKELIPNSSNVLQNMYKPSEIIGIFNSILARQSVYAQLVHLVNDNNGDFYKLGKNNDGIYVSRNAYPEYIKNTLNLSYESKYAFVSSKTTGVLMLSIAKVSDDLCQSPLNSEYSNNHAVRVAFLSWGYLVRKSVPYFLDIDSSELTVGFYITPQTKKAKIFSVKQLENGADYCNYLSGERYKDVPLKAIIMPLIENGVIYNSFTNWFRSIWFEFCLVHTLWSVKKINKLIGSLPS